MPPRATPMSPEQRREALISATRPLLYEHGRAVTTRQIAEAAGVAEGTIFRVFTSKDELVDASLDSALEPEELFRRLDEIPLDAPLGERMLRMTSILQQRLRAVFGLLEAMGLVGPPNRPDNPARRDMMEQVEARMVALLEPDRSQLRVPPTEAVRLLRLLTFAGSHRKFSDGAVLTPEQIVDTILHGIQKKES